MSEWTQMEEELRRGLQHVPAPEGFADRVFARSRQRRWTARTAPAQLGWRMAAAAVLLLAAGGEGVHLQRVREAKRAAAEAQFTLALTLTNHALQAVERGMDRSPVGRYTKLLQDDVEDGDGR